MAVSYLLSVQKSERLWLKAKLSSPIRPPTLHTVQADPLTTSGETLLQNFSPPPMEKCVGHSIKLLDVVQKFRASENSSQPLVSQAGYGPVYK